MKPLDQELADAEADVAAFFGSLSPDEFALRVGSAWTPAEHLDHLNTTVSAVARGLAISPLLLRLRFGRARRPSRSLVELRDDYRARLARGAGASGPFVPERLDLTGDQRSIRQQELLARWRRVNDRLRTALERWSDRKLDRLQLPHPLLGRITAREMVFFTIFHDRHHIVSAKSRLPRFSQAGSASDRV
jgi:hypothetical protein